MLRRQTTLKELLYEKSVNPNNYMAYCDLAQIYWEAMRLTDAHELLVAAIEMEPMRWQAYRQIMYVEKRLGDMGNDQYYSKALLHADELATRRDMSQPEHFEALILKAVILVTQKEYDEAQRILDIIRNAMEKRPLEDLSDLERSVLSSTHAYRGFIGLEKEDQVNFARDEYMRAIEIDEENAQAHFYLGKVCRRLGRGETDLERQLRFYRQAEREYKRAIDLDPNNPDRYQELGLLYYLDLKEIEKALPVFKKYKSLGGVSPSVDKFIVDIERMLR